MTTDKNLDSLLDMLVNDQRVLTLLVETDAPLEKRNAAIKKRDKSQARIQKYFAKEIIKAEEKFIKERYGHETERERRADGVGHYVDSKKDK